MPLKLSDITENVTKVPALPQIVVKLLELLQDPDTSAAQIEDLIQKEPGLAAQVLKLVNSAFYAMPTPIGDIKRAVTILGFREVKNIVVANSISKAFKGLKMPKNFNMTTFWRHSLVNACVTRFMAENSKQKAEGDAFTLGLLHDIGKLILAAYAPETLESIIKLAIEKEISFYDAEALVMSTNHTEIGAWLSEKWKMPPSLTDSIKNHHNPAHYEKHVLTASAHFGNYIASVKKMRCDGSIERMPLNNNVWTILGLQRDALRTVLESVNKEIQAAEAMVSSLE
jgi:putative nucleotidyltransferase with HDIG domain